MFPVWGLATDKLERGGGLFVGKTGVTAWHHFVTSEAARGFQFKPGHYELDILSVEKVKGGGGLRRRYRVLWTGVYGVRGLPVPEHLREMVDSSAEKEIRTAEIRTADESAENAPDIPACTGAGAPARARLSSCLSVLSSTSTTDKERIEAIRAKARWIHREIFVRYRLAHPDLGFRAGGTILSARSVGRARLSFINAGLVQFS